QVPTAWRRAAPTELVSVERRFLPYPPTIFPVFAPTELASVGRGFLPYPPTIFLPCLRPHRAGLGGAGGCALSPPPPRARPPPRPPPPRHPPLGLAGVWRVLGEDVLVVQTPPPPRAQPGGGEGAWRARSSTKTPAPPRQARWGRRRLARA